MISSLFSGRPVVSIPSATYNVVVGNDVTLPCTISASPSVTSISWLFTSNSNNQIQITTSSVKYTVSNVGSFYNLTVKSATTSDAGVYECRATNIIDTSTDSTRLDVTGSEFIQSQRLLAQYIFYSPLHWITSSYTLLLDPSVEVYMYSLASYILVYFVISLSNRFLMILLVFKCFLQYIFSRFFYNLVFMMSNCTGSC